VEITYEQSGTITTAPFERRLPTRTVQIYSINTDSWRMGPDMLVPRSHHGLVRVGDRVYAVGGFTLPDPAAGGLHVPDWGDIHVTRSMEMLEPGSAVGWRLLPPMLVERRGAAVAAVGNRIHVLGGCSAAEPLRSCEVFDVRSATWSPAPDVPHGRTDAAVAVIGRRIFVLGGSNQDGRPTRSVSVLDTATGTWTDLAPFRVPRAEAMAAVVAGRFIWLVAGRGFVDDGLAEVGTIEVFDAELRTWHDAVEWRTPQMSAAAVAADQRVYVFGGLDDDHAGLATARFITTDPLGMYIAADMPTSRGELAAVAV
jgi:N-acetylneuraminic acid mutarotase